MLSKVVGLGIYLLGLGLWAICVAVLAFWASILVLPGALICFFAGYTLNVLGRTTEWKAFRYFWLWQRIRAAFNFVEICSEEAETMIASNKRVIWGVYPHGHFSLTHVFHFIVNPKFADLVPAVHSILFYLPFIGSLVGWLGAIPVEEEKMKDVLRSRGSIIMAPGGISDSYLYYHKIKRHYGFLRIACEMGVPVIPVWCPEERSYYDQWLPLGWTLEKYLFFPIPIFIWGRYGVLPKLPSKSRVYIGNPIVFKDENWNVLMSLEDGQAKYWSEITRLQQLAERNR